MNTKESIDKLRRFKNIKILYGKYALTNEQMSGLRQAIGNVINELEKKDKVIDEMANYIAKITDCPAENCNVDLNCAEECDCEEDRTKKCWKKYFHKKVEVRNNE